MKIIKSCNVIYVLVRIRRTRIFFDRMNKVRYKERAGSLMPYFDFEGTPHQLRHTYITSLLYAGVDPKTVQYLAGHENSKTTMDIYAKVKYHKPEELSGVVNAAFQQERCWLCIIPFCRSNHLMEYVTEQRGKLCGAEENIFVIPLKSPSF